MDIEVVSFDADGTVVDDSYVNEFWFRELPRVYAEERGLELEEAREELLDYYEAVGDEDIRWYRPRYWFERFDLDPDPDEVIERVKVPENVELYEDAVEAIEELEGVFRLIVTSNAPRVFLDYALKDLRGSFEEVYSCVSDFGEVKKDESVYRRVLEQVGVEGERMVHVGDHREFDYRVPREAGIDSFYLDREGERSSARNSRVLSDLRGLVDWLMG